MTSDFETQQRPPSGAPGSWKELLHRRTVLALATLFALAAAFMLWHESSVRADILESTIREDARVYSNVLRKFREVYSAEVVTPLREQGFAVAHDYQEQPGTLPLPATLTMQLGRELGEFDVHTKLYSPFPFPWREGGGLPDEFSRQAWEALQKNPNEPFVRIEEMGGRQALRYATADVMTSACIGCHNTHEQSPKTDWKVGDLRGILEVALPIDAVMTQTRAALQRSILFYSVLGIVAVCVIALVLGRLRRISAELEERVVERTSALAKANSDLSTTQQKLIDEERLRALGLMASGIAHDFNNTLQPILGYSATLLENPQILELEGAADSLRLINEAAKDARAAVSRLNQYQRTQEASPAATEVNAAIEQTVLLTRPKWKDESRAKGLDITIETKLESVPAVAIDKGELRDILTNLIFNAVEAMPKGGTVFLRTSCVEDQVLLEVCDTGEGMPAEVRVRCFDPFFTTKASPRTGLGLAMVQWIVDRQGGRVDIEPRAGGGTCIRLHLPCVTDSSASFPKDDSNTDLFPRSPNEKLNVLLVEDNESVRHVIHSILVGDGHQVEIASSGPEGTRLLESGPFDLVLTDYAMPGINGYQFAQAVKSKSPTTPVILITGFGDEMRKVYEKTDVVDIVLTKPLTPGDLRKAIRVAVGISEPT